MVKGLISSLKGGYVMSDELIKEGLTFLIKGVEVYTIYSMKFQINRANFRSYISDIINCFLDIPEDVRNEMMDICQKWYIIYLDEKTLFKPNNSLKSTR